MSFLLQVVQGKEYSATFFSYFSSSCISIPADTGFVLFGEVGHGLLGIPQYFPSLYQQIQGGLGYLVFCVQCQPASFVAHKIVSWRKTLRVLLRVLLMWCVCSSCKQEKYVYAHLKRWENLEDNVNDHCVGDLFWHVCSCEVSCAVMLAYYLYQGLSDTQGRSRGCLYSCCCA